jgi:hypothetical protein
MRRKKAGASLDFREKCLIYKIILTGKWAFCKALLYMVKKFIEYKD